MLLKKKKESMLSPKFCYFRRQTNYWQQAAIKIWICASKYWMFQGDTWLVLVYSSRVFPEFTTGIPILKIKQFILFLNFY